MKDIVEVMKYLEALLGKVTTEDHCVIDWVQFSFIHEGKRGRIKIGRDKGR
jgi:hypothetical protein